MLYVEHAAPQVRRIGAITACWRLKPRIEWEVKRLTPVECQKHFSFRNSAARVAMQHFSDGKPHILPSPHSASV